MFGHVRVLAYNGFVCYEGRVVNYDMPGGRQVTAVSATGYGVAAAQDWPFYWPAGDTTQGSGGAVFLEALKDTAPLLHIDGSDSFSDPGGLFTFVNMSGRYFSEIVDQISKAENQDTVQMIYTVYEGQALSFVPRVVPTDAMNNPVAHYHIPFNRDSVIWHEDGSKLVGGAAVQWKGLGTSGATDYVLAANGGAGFSDLYGGLLRLALISQTQMEETQADLFAAGYLVKYGTPVITVTCNLDADHALFDQQLHPVPLYEARYGQWVQFGNEDPLMITATDYDASSDKLTLTCSTVG